MENFNNNKSFVREKQKHSNNSIVSTLENHRHVIIGPTNVGKTYYLLKMLGKIGNKRPDHIIIRSPNQYPNCKPTNDTKPIDKNKGWSIFFDDILATRNSSQVDKIFTNGKHDSFRVYYTNQSCFGLPRQNIRNNGVRLILFKQTLRDVESMCKDIGGYDIYSDEFKEMCCQSWSEKFIYLGIDITKNKKHSLYCIFNESKNT